MTHYVANNGVDSGSCISTTPCRTITQAISNANSGDKIVVGPGRYGDLERDGDFVDAGDEASGDSTKMIIVNKTLTIVSLQGATATILEDAAADNMTLVSIEASGVIFGGKGKGFTLKGGATNLTGISVAGATTGVQIIGNITADLNATAMTVLGTGHLLKGNVIGGGTPGGTVSLDGSGHTVRDNVSEGGNFVTAAASSGITFKSNQSLHSSSGHGFDLQGSGHVLKGNIASSANTGFDGFECSGTCTSLTLNGNLARFNNNGFALLAGSGHIVTGNLAAGNLTAGFAASSASAMSLAFTKNESTGNDVGVDFLSDTIQPSAMTGNHIVGNFTAGIAINGTTGADEIHTNNIYGTRTHCGIDMVLDSGTVNAQSNFWGSNAGPGSGPADGLCGFFARINSTPFATRAAPLPVILKLP